MRKQDKIKIMIAEADKSYRDIFSKEAQNDSITVIGEAASELELFQKLSFQKPDVLIFDLYLTSGKLAQTVKGIKKLSEFTKILVLSYDSSVELIDLCMSKGAHCFCNKSIINGDILQDAIEKTHKGQSVILSQYSA